MTRLVPVLLVACVVGIALTAWSQLRAGDTEVDIPDRDHTDVQPAPTVESPLRRALLAARRECTVQALDPLVDRIRATTQQRPSEARAWHLLAEAHLARAQNRSHLRGLTVGKPVFSKLPPELAANLKAGLAAVAKARELGDDSGELCRIEAGLMSQHITGFASAIKWNTRIAKALEQAGRRTRDDPHLHTALGLRKLLAPRWLGHDPAAALEHFEFAANSSDDERPAVFAAMANYVQNKRNPAMAWLERAVERNPDNAFARVCLRRLRRGEQDPFGRDVTPEELADR